MDALGVTAEMAALFSDRAVLDAMLRFEAALARAQARLGMIPAAVAEAIAKLTAGDFDAAVIARDARQSASIVVPFVRALTERVPSAHTGATSQDVLDTALVLLLRDARALLARDHAWLENRLRALSDEHADTVMVARTLMQPAAATTFGYKVACWFGGVHRSWGALAHAFDRGLQLQFGGPCGTLAAFGDRGPELAAALAAELGIPAPEAPWHTERDRMAAIVAHCGIYTGSLAKIARDVTLLMQPELGEAAERGGGSSSMPHKRNPAGSIVALAAANRVPGMVAAYLAGMAQEHERAAGGWQAEFQTVADVVQTTGSALDAVAGALDGLAVDSGRMRANLSVEGSPGAAEAFRRRLLATKE